MSSLIPDSSTRNRSDSTEGSELPEHEHKRPRLSDAEPDQTHVMSDSHFQQMNPDSASTLSPPLAVTDTNSQEEGAPLHTPPLPPRSLAPPQAIVSPTSKVTINTRPLSSQSVTQPIAEPGEANMPSHSPRSNSLVPSTDGSRNPSTAPQAQPEAIDHPDTISIHSSTSKSPEIEIAEPEDYDRDPSQTRWTSRIGGSAGVGSTPRMIPPDHVYQTFPFAHETNPGYTHRMVTRLAERFQHVSQFDGEIFRQVKDWVVDLVSMYDEVPHRVIEEDREFWQRLPDLVEGLVRREAGPHAQARTEDLADFFVAYGQLTKLMIDYDVRSLRAISSDPDMRGLKSLILMCGTYLPPLAWTLAVRIPFYDTLRRAHNFDVTNFLTTIIDRLGDRSAVSLLSSVSDLLSEICALLPKKADLFRYINPILAVTWGFMLPMTNLSASEGVTFGYAAFSQLDAIRSDAAEIILKMDNAIQHAIVKQAAWLNLDVAGKLLEQFNQMVSVIAVEVPQIGQDIVSSAGVGFADSDLTDLPSTMPHAWKFKTLRKFITNGRMELRVYGVDTMSQELVQVFKEHISGRPLASATKSPLVRFLVKFIKDNQLVDYIVGVESHPQLIRRAHNVIGFLCVSGTYTNDTTDHIWNTIVESQDPRTVHEVFNLLQLCFNVYDSVSLYYICHKLLDYPFQRYDPHVLQFTVNLFDNIRNHPPFQPAPQGGVSHDVTRKLCIRLLREASMEENMSHEQSALIRRDFPQQMAYVSTIGRAEGNVASIDEQEQHEILGEAAASLEAHSDHCAGDIQILSSSLPLVRRELVKDTILKFNLPALLVADYAHLGSQYDLLVQRNVPTPCIEAWYDIRSTCLYYLIVTVPETFTEDLVQVLWTSLFAAHNLSNALRDRAWDTLSFAIRGKPFKENPFVDLILDKHFQSLQPQHYSDKFLEFMRHSVPYTIRQAPQHVLDSDDVVVIPGIDRIWKVMLEAPPNTVENEATDFIIRQYLDHSLVTARSKAIIDATHSSLVDRSVRQVIASASKLKSYTDGTMSGEDEPMVIIASEDEIRAEELRFDRSLLFLRKFLEGMKLRPRYSPVPPAQVQTLPDFTGKNGDDLELTIQVHASKYISDSMQKVPVGSKNTCDDLFRYLCDASGFTQFSVFSMGQKLLLAGNPMTLEDAKVASGLLMVHKTLNTLESPPARSTRATSPVDNKIMHHFDDLYDLLDADERLSREVYSFLSLFSAQTEVVRIVRSKDKLPTELLPPGKPFRLLYCARALRSCIEDESFSANPDTGFLIYGIQTIAQVLPKLEVSNSTDGLQMTTAHNLVETLLLAFRAKVPAEISRQYISNHEEFAEQASRLMRFALGSPITSGEDVSASVMVKLILETFVEACLHDDRIWSYVDAEESFTDLVIAAFVHDPRVEVRHSLLEVVVGLTGAAGTKLHLKINNPRAPRSRFPHTTIETCLSHLWTAFAAILPTACLYPEQCAELSETMLVILRRIGKSFSTETLHQYFDQWSSILLHHEHLEVVGQPLRDHVIASLTKLLLECSKWLKGTNALPRSNQLIDKIICFFLFPPLSGNGLLVQESTRLPVLDSTVRENLYNLVLALCQAPQDLATIVTRLNDDLLPSDFFEPIFGHDRQHLRTDVGYAGLRNLSNTCYLNSLFSQLFMNVEFRDFFLNMLGSHDPKQHLVTELAKVFAYMQNSYEKSIDPSGAVEAITTYEGEQIDVSVQMDVDEFFNLLFDRLESQIDHSARNTFRSMYGGQLVQQVKSKECEHISERLEPFSAVQVEIKGKARLEDSLCAYVEGEVLQGENKYSCTSCGRHVDAVKRACLKVVPDNLIFNLKRFDYDIMTGMRAKVNDEFQFPDTLDIAPYTLARLSDEQHVGEPDYFQLTGVIVHSGTADSGHYYSFIRQRPSVKAVQDSWVQFNDQDVGIFDPAQMRDNCFGGTSEAGFYHLPKFYSAYMLFYQRTSSIRNIENEYRSHDAINPVRIPLPDRLEQHIEQQNELYLRSYCAQDNSHALFIRQLLERMVMGDDQCSDDHTLESSMIEMVLEYLRQISGRWKEQPAFEETIRVLSNHSERCYSCARTIAQWFYQNRVLEDVVVRSPYPAVRKSFVKLFSLVFEQLHSLKAGLDPSQDEHKNWVADYDLWLPDCITQLSKLWDVVSKAPRCWPEYFSLLSNVERLGDDETTWLLDEEFLEKCIDIVMMHIGNTNDFPISRRLRTRYPAYLNAREKNRPCNHAVLINFLAGLLLRIDFHQQADGDYRLSDKKIGLTTSELKIVGFSEMPPNLEWLRRLIAGRQNPVAVDSLIQSFAADRRLAGPVSDVLTKGFNDRMISIAASFLRPVVVFSENCTFKNQIQDLVTPALESISTVGIEYGKEYYEFVDALMKVENEDLGLDAGFLKNHVLSTVQHWAPTFLLAPTEGGVNVRSATVELLKQILFDPLLELDPRDPLAELEPRDSLVDVESQYPATFRRLVTTVRELACHCETFVQVTFLSSRSRETVSLQPGQISQLIDVVEHSLRWFDVEDPNQAQKARDIRDTMTALSSRAESTVETLSSADWQENSSEMAELSAEDFEDPLSP